jgi:hypothetical protein
MLEPRFPQVNWELNGRPNLDCPICGKIATVHVDMEFVLNNGIYHIHTGAACTACMSTSGVCEMGVSEWQQAGLATTLHHMRAPTTPQQP